ncbi:MAG TPA: cellulase family glycosylhydrolase [Chthonomonadaceae bacterium]|nr:cellulase family glycosylhydrolase [Chthonomonadaceae bacterium]
MRNDLTRRAFLALGVGAGVTLALGAAEGQRRRGRKVDATHLPRWRGFNLLEKFTLAGNAPYRESDFDLMAEWGFDFVRLPTDYRCWTTAPGAYREDVLKEIDQAIAWGRERNIHMNLCLHRAPGYCVNPPKEPLDLWADGEDGEEARRQFAAQWRMFAERYRDIPSAQLSFDLVNEPGDIPAAPYVRAATAAVEAIRAASADRLVIADGLRWGNKPVPELASLKIAQSTRGYAPMQISHYKASWIHGSDTWPEPTWPLKTGNGEVWDKARLQRDQIAPWKALEAQGVGVHVGEWGAYNKTPHNVVLAWMRDQLDLWRQAGWGWALWNLRGSFGVLDSERQDVPYEDYKGHKLDRQMLELLRQG